MGVKKIHVCLKNIFQVRNPETGVVQSELKPADFDQKLGVFALRYHPLKHDKVYAGDGSGIIYVFDVRTTECAATVSRKCLF